MRASAFPELECWNSWAQEAKREDGRSGSDTGRDVHRSWYVAGKGRGGGIGKGEISSTWADLR